MSRPVYVTTIQDVSTWIANANPGGVYGDESLVSALLGRLQAADHPAWGDDWSEWLDAAAEPIARELVLATEWARRCGRER